MFKKLVKNPHPGDNVVVTNDTHLVITVRSVTGRAVPDVTVKYWLAIRDVTTRDVTLGVADTSSVTLPAFGQQEITTKEVESSYQTLHRDGLKIYPETGTKFYGYGIQVLQGGKVAKEVYEPTELKDVVAGPPNKPN